MHPAQVSPLDRLSLVGDRAMGALSFRPSSQALDEEPDFTLPELVDATQAVIEDRDTPALKALMLVGGSPQGARPKALVQYDIQTRRVSTRSAAPGAPWLVKFPAAGEHPEVCAIEDAYAAIARIPSLEYETWHQASVMGEAREPGREHLLRLARASDVPQRHAIECIERVREVADGLQRRLDDAGVRKATREQMVKVVRGNARRLG